MGEGGGEAACNAGNGAYTPAGLVAQSIWSGPRGPVLAAFLGTILLHATLVLFAPQELPRRVGGAERPPVERLEVVLTIPDEPDTPDEFIMTNPEALSNPPDETRFFADRDQQAAQEEKAVGGDPSLPRIDEGEPEPTQNIVETDTLLPWEEQWESIFGDDGGFAMEPLTERPIPGFEPFEADEEGLDVPVAVEVDANEDLTIGVVVDGDQIEGYLADSGVDESESGEERAVVPRPRPALPQFSRGPAGVRHGAAPRVGTVAVDANFSEFGDYLSRMLDAIVRQWHLLAWDALQAGEVGTLVAVSFRINENGAINGLEVEHSTASLIATLICKDAISSRQPYGPWTSDMREILGEEQTIRIRFFYR